MKIMILKDENGFLPLIWHKFVFFVVPSLAKSSLRCSSAEDNNRFKGINITIFTELLLLSALL